MGIVGAVVIARWSWRLMRDSALVLLDATDPAPGGGGARDVESAGDARITDLHLWRVGPDAHAAIVSVTGSVDAEAFAGASSQFTSSPTSRSRCDEQTRTSADEHADTRPLHRCSLRRSRAALPSGLGLGMGLRLSGSAPACCPWLSLHGFSLRRTSTSPGVPTRRMAGSTSPRPWSGSGQSRDRNRAGVGDITRAAVCLVGAGVVLLAPRG